MATRDLIFDIFAIDRASAVFSRVGAEADGMGTKMSRAGAKAAGGLMSAAAIVSFGVSSIKAASDFQASMQRIQTLAMGGKGNIEKLGQSVVGLASQVGYSPNSLAAALYHIESNFYSVGLGGAQALSALKIAAEGAQIGNANLVDVTNALGAAIASGIPGVQNYKGAMQSLLATVGSGDMQMQDLADAFGTGILAIGKQFGMTMRDVGAALATFGDNNIRGAEAGTKLRQAIMDLTLQSKGGVKVLESLGVKSGELGAIMRKSGFIAAVADLRSHLIASGIPMQQWGQIATEVFTKRSAAPLAILLGQFDRLQSKLEVLKKGGTTSAFDSAWAARLGTTAQQFAGFTASFDAFRVQVGEVIGPIIGKLMEGLTPLFNFLATHKQVIEVIAGMLAGLLVPALAAVAAMAFEILGPVDLAFMAIGGGFVYLEGHSKTFRAAVAGVMDWMAHTAFPALKQAAEVAMHAIGAVFQWFQSGPLVWLRQQFSDFAAWWTAHQQEISQVAHAVWAAIGATVRVWSAMIVAQVKYFWPIVSAVIGTALHVIEDLVGIVLDVVTGHWSKAWHELLTLTRDVLTGLWNVIKATLGNLPGEMLQLGEHIVSGLTHGIEHAASGAVGAVKNLAGSLIHGAMGALGINSPSKEFIKIGSSVGEGFALGIANSTAPVTTEARKMAAAVKRATMTALHVSSVELNAQLSADNAQLTKVNQQIAAAEAWGKTFEGNVFSAALTLPSTSRQMMVNGTPVTITDSGQGITAKSSPAQVFAAMMSYQTAQAKQAATLAADVGRLRKEGISAAVLAQMQGAGANGLLEISALAHATRRQVAAFDRLVARTQASLDNTGALATSGKAMQTLQNERNRDAREVANIKRALHGVKLTIANGGATLRPA